LGGGFFLFLFCFVLFEILFFVFLFFLSFFRFTLGCCRNLFRFLFLYSALKRASGESIAVCIDISLIWGVFAFLFRISFVLLFSFSLLMGQGGRLVGVSALFSTSSL